MSQPDLLGPVHLLSSRAWFHTGVQPGMPLPSSSLYMDDSSGDESPAGAFDDDDLYALKRGRVTFNFSKNYCPKWTPEHAFRELYQNW